MPRHSRARATTAALALTLLAWIGPAAQAQDQAALRSVETDKSFQELVDAVKQAVEASGMFVVTQACASCGAAKRGVTIPGNMVLGVFRNDFAVRMLAASVPAGIEAPIRFYVTEDDDGSASLHYRMPSAVFAPYPGDGLDSVAGELDQIWQQIVDQATAG